MSVGADDAVSYRESDIDKLAEQLIAQNITVVAAVGNDESSLILANSEEHKEAVTL